MGSVLKISILVLLALVNISECTQFSSIRLALELFAQGFPLDEINDWVCLVMLRSDGRTDQLDRSGETSFYGLFQIGDTWWCSGHGGTNNCNVRCEDLAKDDITEASRCAKHIKKQQGFKEGWGYSVGSCKEDYTGLLLGNDSKILPLNKCVNL